MHLPPAQAAVVDPSSPPKAQVNPAPSHLCGDHYKQPPPLLRYLRTPDQMGLPAAPREIARDRSRTLEIARRGMSDGGAYTHEAHV